MIPQSQQKAVTLHLKQMKEKNSLDKAKRTQKGKRLNGYG